MSSDYQSASAMLDAALELAEYASYAEIVGGISVNRPQIREWCDKVFAANRALPADPVSSEGEAKLPPDLEIAEFKPCRLDLSDSGMAQWAFEDVANVANPAFPGVYHFIDEIRAMDDGRLVGIQFWGPPPKPSAVPDRSEEEDEAQSTDEIVREVTSAFKADVARIMAEVDNVQVPKLDRPKYFEPHRFLLICSYCGNDNPQGCSNERPCADCLNMCNVFGEDGEYIGTVDRTDPRDAEIATLREALEFYGENARLCRLIHSGGDEGRQALSDDGGKIARAALARKTTP